MFILFSLIVMRMSGAVAFNSLLGRTNYPRRAKAALILMFSLLLYSSFHGNLLHEPTGMLEYGIMLVKELLFGFVLGFAMELSFFVVRFSSAIMDYSMGLSMAQIYDPQYNTQMTITSGMFYAYLVLLFFAVDGHLRLIHLFFSSAQAVPFGMITLSQELPQAIFRIFKECVVLGFQLAFPLLAMELITEVAVGILMKIIPQINVFVVNFQLKIIVGLLMLVFLFNPMSDRLFYLIDQMFRFLEGLIPLLG